MYNSNIYAEKNELIYGQEYVVAALLQILSWAKNLDICTDFRAPSMSTGVEPYKKAGGVRCPQ
ncbi:MAG: hypothetical protein WBE61_06160 [Nitrososphaeraceae archaeon]